MMKPKRKLRRLRRNLVSALLAGGLVGGLTSAQPAGAELACTPESAMNGDLFTHTRCNMPDVDQRRAAKGSTPGLPGNGDMYCVPTAAMDLLAYIAAHGYPQLAPKAADWADPSNYDAMTNHLAMLGTVMNTSASGGTNHGGAHWGLVVWLGQAPGLFSVTSTYASGFWSPTASTIATEALAGNLVEPVVGWYTNADGAGNKSRDGGHALSLTGIKGDLGVGEPKQIRFRDPATDSDYGAQSNYAHDTRNTMDVLAKFDGYPRFQSRVVGYGSAYLDGYFAIKPKYGLVPDADGSLNLITPVLAKMNAAAGINAELIKQLKTSGKVVDVAISPVGSSHLYLVAADPSVWQIDTVTERSTRLATLQNPRRIVIGGPENTAFVLQESELVALDRSGTVVARTQLSTPLDDIAYDSRTDRLVGVSTRSMRVQVYDGSLELVSSNPVADLPIPDGPVSASVDPSSASATTLWVTTGADGKAFRIELGEPDTRAVTVALSGVGAPSAVHVDDRGHLFVTAGGVIRERTADGRTVHGSVFEGRPGGAALDISGNFTNYDRTMTGPAYRNVLPQDAVE